MKHKGTVQIETERLILRRFIGSDYIAAYKNWTADKEVTKFLRWMPHSDEEETKSIIDAWIKEYKNITFYHWAIELKSLGEVIGSIGAVGMNEKTETFHFGYCIGKEFWHQGIMSEAFAAVIEFMFDKVGASRIESQHDPDNVHSGDVMKKCGMKYEGTLRSADWSNKGIVDAAVYGLLKSEYKK